MASCHGSEESTKRKYSKRGYHSPVDDPSPGQKSKIQRVGDDNGNMDNYSEQMLPRFLPNSVILLNLAGQVVGTVENMAELNPKGESASHKLTPDANAKNNLKRKRDSMVESFNVDKESSISSLRSELDGLFKYFDEVSDQNTILGREDSAEEKGNMFSNSTVACLLEESRLPFSKLVEQIFDKLNKNGSGDSAEVTLSSVRSSVLFVGQRSMYGIPKADADVLEDESRTCLWCWEVRDLKLLPKSQRGTINVRRSCRKKIHDRIMAVSAIISSLSAPENQTNYRSDLMKAAEKIVRISDEEQIRAFANSLIQRHSVLGEEDTKLKEKALIKEMEQNKRMVEKEQKRLEKELKKEQLRNEKELKRQLDISAKERKQREKEEAEMRKQLRRHQEEAEKDKKRHVRHEAELKKQLAIKKQASIMERFLKQNVNTNNTSNDQSSKGVPEPVPSAHSEGMSIEVVSSMDETLSQADNLSSYELLKLHLVVWKGRTCSASRNKSKCWGVRHHPKVELIKELRLQRTSCVASPSGKVVDSTKHACSNMDDSDELNIEKIVDGWGEAVLSDGPTLNTVATGSVDMQNGGKSKKLLQFDKSHRPAYYGTMSRRSDVVGPRHPLRKDPNLDYDNDSDEEWEEEDPGENLSDFDKDDEEENIESNESPKAEDEDESEEGFVVPDGYLSENEGVYVDGLELDNSDDESKISTTTKIDGGGDFNALLKQQKYLSSLTNHALRKNQPLIILNLMHEKDVLMTAEPSATQRLEQICLQALSICPMTEGVSIDITSNWERCEDTCSTPDAQANNSNFAAVTILQESDLPEIVSSIQRHSHGINKVIESLQKKFPSVPKVHLRNKVKEISCFLDNHWQVKKDILDKLGLSASPEKHFMRSKEIATFFKKRCLPPEGEFVSTVGSSIQLREKN